MPDFENDSERQLLRSINRRRRLRGLAVALPATAAWLLLAHWIARRWNLQPDLVRFAILLVFVIPAVFAPRLFGRDFNHDPRETFRLRWLNKERADQQIARGRIIQVIGFSLILLIRCVTLLGPRRMDATFSDSDVLVWSVVAAALGLRWRPADLGDEGAQLRYLTAVNRAFMVTLVACLAAILLDAYWHGGILRPALEAALLIGCLTVQLSLVVSEPRTAPDSE